MRGHILQVEHVLQLANVGLNYRLKAERTLKYKTVNNIPVEKVV